MATNAYGLADLNYPARRFKCATNNEEIVFSVFGGALSVGVVKAGEWKPFWRQQLPSIRQQVLIQRMRMLINKAPNTKDPITFSRWDKDQKKQLPEWGIEFQKDDKMIYHIIVSWKGNRHDGIVKGPFGISYGNENIEDAEGSQIAFEEFIKWMDRSVPIQMQLSNRRREQDGERSSRGGKSQTKDVPAPGADEGDNYW